MLPDRQGLVRVRANIDGEVEIRAHLGEAVVPRQLIAITEGDEQIESLSVRKTSIVESILVKTGTEVTAGTTLMVVREVEED
jgi:hypothetical protein